MAWINLTQHIKQDVRESIIRYCIKNKGNRFDSEKTYNQNAVCVVCYCNLNREWEPINKTMFINYGD